MCGALGKHVSLHAHMSLTQFCIKQFIPLLITRSLTEMSVFSSRVCPVTGKYEWVIEDENYDYHQEIARAAYADMLHDTERNQKYYSALREAIHLQHSFGKPANVLDIGTGTGLLSMMAARCGADSITACEAFAPMAKCAAEVMRKNGFQDKIRLVPKRSTEMTVGSDGDMPEKANILVTEVFDTELIGEGGIGTFHHAHKFLLTDDCIVVPSRANMYVQIVEADLVWRWNKLHPITVSGHDDITPPAELDRYDNMVTVHDLQLDQLRQDQFRKISEPVKIFSFDYSGKTKIEFSEETRCQVVATATGQCHGIFMWWDLQMDTMGDIMLSCAPRWAHPEPDNMQWRDHWMQAIYYPSHPMTVSTGQKFFLHGNYDEYSLRFNVSREVIESPFTQSSSPLHLAYSRSRLGMVNDMTRNAAYVEALTSVVTPDTRCLCMGDGSLLPLVVARLGARHVYTVEKLPVAGRMLDAYIESNGLKDKVTVIDTDTDKLTSTHFHGERVNLLLSEPFFNTTLLPWHNLYFWYVRTELSNLLAEDVNILPKCAVLKAAVVDFKDLWKIRAPVGNCEGFDLSVFDNLIEASSDKADAIIEPQPLWEYPGTALSEAVTLMEFDFTKLVTSCSRDTNTGRIPIQHSSMCNGVAVWMEYCLDKEQTILTGPLQPVKPGQTIVWDMYTKQGVHLFKRPRTLMKDSAVTFSVTFMPKNGDLDFSFEIETS